MEQTYEEFQVRYHYWLEKKMEQEFKFLIENGRDWLLSSKRWPLENAYCIIDYCLSRLVEDRTVDFMVSQMVMQR